MNKFKILLSSLLFLLLGTGVNAQGVIAVEDFSVPQGETQTVSINLTEDYAGLYTGLSFYVTLPEGLTFVKGEAGEMVDDHVIDASLTSDGTKVLVVLYSMSSAVLGDAGEIATLTFQAAEDVQPESEGEITFSTIRTTNAASEATAFEDFTVKVTYTESVPVAKDVIDYTIQGYENAQEIMDVAVSSGDVTAIVALGEGKTTPKYYNTGTAIRIYGGNTLTISSAKTIEKIVFNYSSNAPTADNSTVSVGELNYATQTWTGSAKEVVLTNTATSGHFRLQSFTVYYAAEAEPVYIETDLTAQFSSLTEASNWTTGAGGKAGFTATQFCPAVPVNGLGNKQVCEFYEASCERTGDMLYQTVSGLAPGTYKIELYGATAYTFGRGFSSTAFAEGEWNAGDKIEPSEEVSTGVTLYAETSEGAYGGEIPIYYATSFPDGAATVVLDGVVVGENGEVKIGMSKTSTSTNWHVIQLKGVTATVLATDALAAAVATAEAIEEGSVPATLYEEIEGVVAENNKEYDTAEEYVAAIEAINAAVEKAVPFTVAAPVLAAMKAVVEATNIYTAEAYEAYYGQWAAKFDAGTLTEEEARALQNPSLTTGWHADITVDDFLLSAWDAEAGAWSGYYINTWSTEGDSDGSEFRVPFFEYWTGDANSLGEKTLTATMNELPEGVYDVTAWVRVRVKNGVEVSEENPAMGITLSVNEGEPVDVAAGVQVEGTQFYLDTFTAAGAVGEDGVLKIQFNIAAENNISWLSFKNVKFAKNEEKTVGIATVVRSAATAEGIYSVSGARRAGLQKGLNIVKYADGSVKKVLVK